MRIYKTYKGHIIKLSLKNPFYAEKSMLRLRAVGISSAYKQEDIKLQVFYKNKSGARLTCPLTLYSPYHFNALTPDLENMLNARPLLFDVIEIQSEAEFPFGLAVEFNSHLASGIKSHHIAPR